MTFTELKNGPSAQTSAINVGYYERMAGVIGGPPLTPSLLTRLPDRAA